MDNELKKKIDGHVGNLLIDIVTAVKIGAHRKPPNNPRRILLIKFWGVGNLIMLTPTMKALRKRYPQAKINFLTLYKNKGLLEHIDYLDNVIYYDLGALDAFRILNLILKYYRKFDIVIDFEQFLNISAIIGYYLGEYRIGFSNKTRSRHKLYDYVKPCDDEIHVLEQFYSLLGVLGISGDKLELDNFRGVRSVKVERFFKEIKLGKRYLIGAHIGSSINAEVRRWPKASYVKVINTLNHKFDNLAFVMSGTLNEKEYVDSAIAKINKKNVFNSCGKFNLIELIYFMKKCRLFLSNDTGPIHMAAAAGVTCFGFYGPTSPLLYRPYGKQHTIFYNKTKCSPCINNYSAKSTNCRNTICMRGIKPGKVAKKIVNYIKRQRF